MTSIAINMIASGGIDKFPAKAHARRIASRLQRESGLITLAGTRSALFSHSDMPVPFRQDRYFYYLTGCDEPNCLVTYDIAKDWLALWLPPISWARFYYDGRGSTVEEAEQAYDIDEARYISSEEGVDELEKVLENVDDRVFLLNTERERLPHDMTVKKRIDFDLLRPAADACRAVKDEHEIELIRKANQITAAAHEDVLRQLHTCNSEAEAEAIYLKRCIASLAKVQSYEPIFAAGENASFLHYIQDNKAFGDSQVLLVDAGCEWQRYASDVTRTMPLNRKKPGYWPSKEAEQIYNAVERIQEQCISHMGANATFSGVNRLAQDLVVKELLELGILKGKPADILHAGTHRAFLPHGLGHHMGLEVHDVMPPARQSLQAVSRDNAFDTYSMPHGGVLKVPSTASIAEPLMEKGNVITVEPGIYFNKFVLDRFFLPDEKHAQYIDQEVLKRYLPVGGVRIEDDILISDYGPINLTTAPKGEAMLRIIRDAAAGHSVDRK